MSQLVADCPRCGATHNTFDLLASVTVALHYNWQHWREAFCVCRYCHKSTVFVLSDKGIEEGKHIEKVGLPQVASVNDVSTVQSYINLANSVSTDPPEFVPVDIEAVFKEGAVCLSVQCFNAAATMFRLCVDLATTALLPADGVDGLNRGIRRSLGLRLGWLFDTHRLPEALRELSHCIKEDGNDGAHEGTLTKADAEDLLDFTVALLERLYTEPERLRLAAARRAARRTP